MPRLEATRTQPAGAGLPPSDREGEARPEQTGRGAAEVCRRHLPQPRRPTRRAHPSNNQTNGADENTHAHTASEPATEARPSVAETTPHEPLGNETCDGALNASEEAAAEPVDTQAEPESSESGPVQQEPAAVAQSAAAETAQHEQLGNKARDGAVDASRKAPTSRVAATSIASRTASPAVPVRRSARISASSAAAQERSPLLTTQQASLRPSGRKDANKPSNLSFDARLCCALSI